MVVSPEPPERAALLAVKLRALVRDHLGSDGGDPSFLQSGASLDVGGERWLLIEGNLRRALGGAVAAGLGATRVHLVVDAPSTDSEPDPYASRSRPAGVAVGDLARRATFFAAPSVSVWEAHGRELRPADPVERPVPPPLPPEVTAFADVITAAGADPVVEHGVLIAEVDGLEAGRAYLDADGVARLVPGVGRHDQDAFAMVHYASAVEDNLAEVVRRIAAERVPGSHHPLNRLAAERRLRRRLVEHPDLVGADHLVPVPPVLPQPNLLHPFPAAAAGTDLDGQPLLCVCSAGADLDLVPTAADLRDAHDGTRTLLVVPEGDDLTITRRLAAALADPVELLSVSPLGP